MADPRHRRRSLEVIAATAILVAGAAAAAASGHTDIVSAAKQQDWAAVEVLLEARDVGVNTQSPDGATALAWAAHWDHLPTAKRLLRADADPDVANAYGVTPLMLAAQNRSRDMVRLLLDRGADPDARTWNGLTALMMAARTGDVGVIDALLDRKADIDASDPKRGQTALMRAIAFAHPEAAQLLIDRGAYVDAHTVRLREDYTPMELEAYTANVSGTEQGGYTPLIFAARYGDMASARALVEAGANVDAVSATDGPALVVAAAYGHEDIALMLLEAGADPGLADSGGMTALHYAFRDGVKILHGYNISAGPQVCNFGGDPTRCKPLGSLSEQERAYFADPATDLYLVEEELDPREPLPGRNMHGLAEALLDAGADPNAAMKFPPAHLRLARLTMINLTGATPFFLAAAAQDLDGMRMMLAREDVEADIETRIDEHSFYEEMEVYADDNQILGNATTLLVAAGLGRKSDFSPDEEARAIEAVATLIRLGADVNAATATGWTAVHAAAYIGAEDLLRFLVDSGASVNVMTACGQTPMSLALGTSVAGLLDRTVPQVDTAELLLDLGAANVAPDRAVGRCVLGRGGLEADVAQNALVQSRIDEVLKKLDARSQ